MSTPYYIPETNVPLPPKGADVITTACDYCIVACGYKVYRWPVAGAHDGGPKADENAFGVDFPVETLGPWVAPNQHNIVLHDGEPHHVVIIPDKETKFVNTDGDSSLRGGCIAQKCYNPQTPTRDRLKSPMMRIYGILQPVPWDFALDVAAEVGRYVRKAHGDNAYGVKTYSYQFIENTYAITKYALRHINTANFTFHDTPSDVSSTPGFRDAGFDNFGPAYEDWMNAETLLICGTDPYETKTILWTQWIMKGIQNGQKCIMMNPRRTAGVAYAEKNGGLWLDVNLGTDLLVVNAIARVIAENGWQDAEWIKKWVNNKWESSSGFGQGTRNTPWQWRTTWGKFQTNGYEDWKKWLLSQDEFKPEHAAKVADIDVKKIYQAAEWMAKPVKGKHPKTSIMIEKGFYWSNNTGNTQAISALAIIVGAGGRPGQVVGRAGGHQRGGQRGGKYPRNKSPMKLPGRRRRALDTDTWTMSGHTRFAHVIGTTWIQSMCGSQQLSERFEQLTVANPHQVRSYDKHDIIDTLKKRADSGGMVVINQDIYLVDPIGNRYADIIFPAATWGEETFMRANGERRLRVYNKFYDPPGEAKPDWWIIGQLAKRMGFDGFDWKNSNEVAEESARFSRGSRKDFNMIKVAAKREGKTLHQKLGEFGTNGIQGPVFMKDDGTLVGTKRLHDTTRKLPEEGPAAGNVFNKKLTHFNSQTGKCNIQKSPWNLFSDYWEWMKPKGAELWCTSGRTNERWQSGFDDRRRPYIVQRWPDNYVEMHPDDAKSRGIENGDMLMVYSDRVPSIKETILGVEGSDYSFSGQMKAGNVELTRAAVTGVAMVMPNDADLMRMVRDGMPGTAMPGWSDLLSEQDMWDVIAYIKTFAELEGEPEDQVDYGTQVKSSPESIAAGDKLFHADDRCSECHGLEGRGDAIKKLKNDNGERTWPRNLTKPWTYRASADPKDIFTRVSVGIPTTQMPSFADPKSKKKLSIEERWHVANYVASLSATGKAVRAANTVIQATRVAGQMPGTPDDAAWASAPPSTFFMVPQIVGKTRFFKTANDTVTVRALYDDENISLLLEWDDRTKSIPGDAKAISIADADIAEDAIAVQFPRTIPVGMEKPYFLMGDPAKPVNLWRWSSGTSEQPESAAIIDAEGIEAQTVREDAAGLAAKGQYKDGTWRVIMTRSLKTETVDNDLQIEQGRFIPIAFFAWDGSNSEAGTHHAMTTWYWILLKPDAGAQPLIAAFLVVLLLGGVLVWWGRSAARRVREDAV